MRKTKTIIFYSILFLIGLFVYPANSTNNILENYDKFIQIVKEEEVPKKAAFLSALSEAVDDPKYDYHFKNYDCKDPSLFTKDINSLHVSIARILQSGKNLPSKSASSAFDIVSAPLSSILDSAEALRKLKCYDVSSKISDDIIKIYIGSSFAAFRQRAQINLQKIAEERSK